MVSTLGALVREVEKSGLGSPAIVVIGEVVSLAALTQTVEPVRSAA